MNKIMNEYLNKINNEEENLETIKRKILEKKLKKSRLINMVAVVLVIVMLGTFSPKIYGKFQQDKKYKEYTRRNYVSGSGQIASAYSEEVNMDYVFQNDIGVKIDSFVLTDDSFKANISFKLPEEMRLDKLPENNNDETSIIYTFGYAVYDENNNIYDINNRMDAEAFEKNYDDYMMCIYKDLGIKNNNKFLSKSGGIGIAEKNEDKIVCELEINSLAGFPNSKKLYIRIFNIGYHIGRGKNKDNYDSKRNNLEWNFEIETPDKFLKRETTNLILLDEIPNLKINKFIVTETGMILKAQKKDVVKTMAARERYG